MWCSGLAVFYRKGFRYNVQKHYRIHVLMFLGLTLCCLCFSIIICLRGFVYDITHTHTRYMYGSPSGTFPNTYMSSTQFTYAYTLKWGTLCTTYNIHVAHVPKLCHSLPPFPLNPEMYLHLHIIQYYHMHYNRIFNS